MPHHQRGSAFERYRHTSVLVVPARMLSEQVWVAVSTYAMEPRPAILYHAWEPYFPHHDVNELPGSAPPRDPRCGGHAGAEDGHSTPTSAQRLAPVPLGRGPVVSVRFELCRAECNRLLCARTLPRCRPHGRASRALAGLPPTCPSEVAVHHDFRWRGCESEHLRCSAECSSPCGSARSQYRPRRVNVADRGWHTNGACREVLRPHHSLGTSLSRESPTPSTVPAAAATGVEDMAPPRPCGADSQHPPHNGTKTRHAHTAYPRATGVGGAPCADMSANDGPPQCVWGSPAGCLSGARRDVRLRGH